MKPRIEIWTGPRPTLRTRVMAWLNEHEILINVALGFALGCAAATLAAWWMLR